MDTVSSRPIRFSCRQFMKELFYGFLTEYETPKIVMIHSYAITALLRIMQIILLLYSIFYLLLYEKGYQKQDTSIISSITLKVKGIGFSQTPNNHTFVFDGADYIIPPSENNAIFIMTNFIPTDQSRSACEESASISAAQCTKDGDCQNKPFMSFANGRWTGRCLLSPVATNFSQTDNIAKKRAGLCEIQGWCPVEDDRQKRIIIQEIRNFTIFIKNFIEFPTFNVKHKNMVENLKPCVYHPTEHSDCPIFRLDYILNESEKNSTEREMMLQAGAVISVKLNWDCNLDRSIKLCKPVYSFARLDTPFHQETFSPGFNFRFASHWKHGEEYIRSLKKAFGLRLIISVSGKAGKLDFITLTLNTGSLVGIFGLATFFCDLVLLNLTKKASVYRNHVFQRVHSVDTRNDSIPYGIRRSTGRLPTILANPNTDTRTMSEPFSIVKSFARFSNTSQSSDLIVTDQLSKSKPNLGLTNTLK